MSVTRGPELPDPTCAKDRGPRSGLVHEPAVLELGAAAGLVRLIESLAASIAPRVQSATALMLDDVARLSRHIEGRCFDLASECGLRVEYSDATAAALNKGERALYGYLRHDAPAVDHLDYLAMVQAETLGHWTILGHMEYAGLDPEFRLLSVWASEAIREQMSLVVRAAVEFDTMTPPVT